METIDSWEKRKKMKARRKLNKQEVSLTSTILYIYFMP